MRKKFLCSFFILFILISFTFSNNVFASIDYTYNDSTITLPDLPFNVAEHPDYVIIYNSGESAYQVGYPESSFDKFYIVNAYGKCITYNIKDTTEKGQWIRWEFNGTKWTGPVTTTAHYMQHVDHILYSSFDIYTSATSNEIFFQRTPVPLAQALEMYSPTLKFQTMMSGMIPYLIVFLVGLVAFWKAWQLLLKELRRA